MDIINFTEFKKMKNKKKIKDDDVKDLLARLISVTYDLAMHLGEAKEEIKKLKQRQLKLAEMIQQLEEKE